MDQADAAFEDLDRLTHPDTEAKPTFRELSEPESAAQQRLKIHFEEVKRFEEYDYWATVRYTLAPNIGQTAFRCDNQFTPHVIDDSIKLCQNL